MADVRCPMCGKPNSDDLEICQFCQARLKPLIAPPTGEASTGELSSSSRAADPRESETDSEPEESIPDWLQSLRPGGVQDEYETPQGADDETPPWAPRSDTGDLKLTPAEAEANYRDWLSSLRGGDEESQTAAAEEESAADWLSSETEAGSEEMPGWLSELRTTSEEFPVESHGAETAPLSQSEDPEWLRQLRDRRRREEAGEEGEGEKPSEVSDYLANLSTSELTEAPAPPDAEAQLPEEEDIPDWLSGMVEAPSDDQPEDLPDWLVSGDLPPEEEVAPGALQEQPGEGLTSRPLEADANIPDWLSGIMENQPELSASELPLEEEIPDWLAGKERGAGRKKETDKELKSSAEFDWLQAQEQIPAKEKPADDQPRVVAPFTFDEETASLDTDELPDWLKEASAPEGQPESAAISEEDAALTPAALPAWLEAMRPVEAAAPGVPSVDESERNVESSGPLAGLRGILRAEPDIARQKKPPAYTIKLQVSESHQAHAAILEKLINAEGVVTPVKSRAAVSRQMLWRLAIFILLLLAAALPIYTGSQEVALPPMPGETFAARELINQLPDHSNVLVGVDYEPGFAGEMDAASASLIDHLMIKGSYLALVSTSPSGPAQAERLVSLLNREGSHQYASPMNYANLGFVPGGIAGLLGFVEAPQKVLPYALDGSSAWTNENLAGIGNLADFSLMLVLTENPDTARAWIEQVQPHLGETPLLLVVSAQAEPLVRPYFEGAPQQVRGMLVGLAGGAAYESGMPRAVLARRYWDAYSYALAAAILLMLAGGAANVLPQFLKPRKNIKGEV